MIFKVSVFKETFRKRIKEARKQRNNMSQAAFAEEISVKGTIVSPSTVKKWEQGRSLPEYNTLEALCSFLNCDIEYLLGEIDCKTLDAQFIYEKTGLKEDTVNALSSWKDYPAEAIVLNYLIKEKKLLQKITAYFAAEFTDEARTSSFSYLIGTDITKQKALAFADLFDALPRTATKFYEEMKAYSFDADTMAAKVVSSNLGAKGDILVPAWISSLLNLPEESPPTPEDCALAKYLFYRGEGDLMARAGIDIHRFFDIPE